MELRIVPVTAENRTAAENLQVYPNRVKYQGRGYAKAAIRLILRRIINEYPNESIYLSVYEENATAISIYKYYGFEFTGEIDTKGEKIMLYKGDINI